MKNRSIYWSLSAATLATALLFSGNSNAQTARPSRVQNTQDALMAQIPHCTRNLGTISVVDGSDTHGWSQHQLAPPARLLKVIVQRSGCFSLVDRGAGFTAAQRERDINADMGLQRGSNVGQNQVRAADFILVAEIAAADSNTSGGAAAGILGGIIGGRAGGIVGGLRTKKLEADVVLSLTDARTTESSSYEGHAAKNDLTWGAGGGLGFGGVVGGGYEDTEIGRIVTQAYIVGYSAMVNQLGGLRAGAAEAPSRSYTVNTVTTMRTMPQSDAPVVRALAVGMVVYPTGKRDGIWWEIADDNDNVGWVQNDKLQASQ